MKNLFFIVSMIICAMLIGGCTSTTSKETKPVENPTVTKAIENGKLATANGEFDKAKSNFELAISEDKKNSNAEEWLSLVSNIQSLETAISTKEIENTDDLLKEIKENKHYSAIKSKVHGYKSTIQELKISKEKKDKEIASLKNQLDNKEYQSVIEKGKSMQEDKNIFPSQLTEVKNIVEQAKKKLNEQIVAQQQAEKEAQQKAEQERKIKEEKQKSSTLSLVEMRRKAKNFVDNWNGFDNQLLDEYDSGDVRVYEFKDGDATRIVGVTVNPKTGEVKGDQGMY
ncbi:hypothetical protein SAMN05428981_11062 [Bacillus sp. OV194]|nr:hypothetical protein SAMN05428981_11062 [Bacillus sp. OV194]